MNVRKVRRITCLWGLALFGLPVWIAEASAESAANLELVLSTPMRPYSIDLFFNQRISPDSRFNAAVNLGGLFRQRADRHKFGIEAFAPFRNPDDTTLVLGYYGTISHTVSIKIFAGANINAGQDRVALAELVWQIN